MPHASYILKSRPLDPLPLLLLAQHHPVTASTGVQLHLMTTSMVEAAPAPTWTLHFVRPVVIELLLAVAVYPFVAPTTVAVLPNDSEKLVLAARAAKSTA